MSQGSNRWRPRGARSTRGKSRSGSIRSPAIEEPAPPVCGWVLGLGLNGMQGVAVNGVVPPGQLVVSEVLNTPVPLKALETHTYGVGAGKTATPPRRRRLA